MPSRKNLALILLALVISSGAIVSGKETPQKQIIFVYNQVGYYPQENKVIYIQLDQPYNELKMNYILSSSSKIGQILLNGTPQYAGYQFNEFYYSVDLSNFADIGTYQLTVSIPGYPSASILLTINPEVYNQALLRATQFYYYQRSGSAINSFLPGYPSRPADCLDDGEVMTDTGNWVYHNMSGGWHDAGDYGKYMEWFSNTQWATYCLAATYENDPNFFNNCTKYYGGILPERFSRGIVGCRFSK